LRLALPHLRVSELLKENVFEQSTLSSDGYRSYTYDEYSPMVYHALQWRSVVVVTIIPLIQFSSRWTRTMFTGLNLCLGHRVDVDGKAEPAPVSVEH
jgi:hypothetical protein